jgi:tripartite-type tricarboxylate transporter receptor subunit TctC
MIKAIAAAVLMTMLSVSAQAQTYPTHPIRVILALGAGGIGDIFMRAVGEEFRKRVGVPLVIENRPGGAFNIAAKACAEAAPDGYTICLLPVEALSYNRFLFKNPGYDTRSFEPITNVYTMTLALVVNSSLGVKSLDELAALAKAKPKTLAYTTPAVSAGLFMENWTKASGADIVKVPFRGGAEAANAILQGAVPISFSGLPAFIPHIQAGAITPLAVDSDQRSPLLPNVPTLRELGYTGPLTQTYSGLVAPKGTPKEIIENLNKIFVEIAAEKSFSERHITRLGMVPILDTPDHFAAYLKESERAAGTIVKDSGIEPQ